MDLVTTLVTLVLGGGGLSTVVGIVVAKRKRKVDADSVVVQGAETAVLTLQRAVEAERASCERTAAERDRLTAQLAREIARRESVEKQLDAERARREALEAKLDFVQRALDEVREELRHAREGGLMG